MHLFCQKVKLKIPGVGPLVMEESSEAHMETDVSSTTEDVPEVQEVTGSGGSVETVIIIEKLDDDNVSTNFKSAIPSPADQGASTSKSEPSQSLQKDSQSSKPLSNNVPPEQQRTPQKSHTDVDVTAEASKESESIHSSNTEDSVDSSSKLDMPADKGNEISPLKSCEVLETKQTPLKDPPKKSDSPNKQSPLKTPTKEPLDVPKIILKTPIKELDQRPVRKTPSKSLNNIQKTIQKIVVKEPSDTDKTIQKAPTEDVSDTQNVNNKSPIKDKTKVPAEEATAKEVGLEENSEVNGILPGMDIDEKESRKDNVTSPMVVIVEKEASNDSQTETPSDGTDKDHNKSISRELKSLIKSAKESKIISECTQLTSKTRKSRAPLDTSNPLNTSVETGKIQSRRNSTNSLKSNCSEKSDKTTVKRSMRSQNPEFVNKVKLFLNSVTKIQKDSDEGSDEEVEEVKIKVQPPEIRPSTPKKKRLPEVEAEVWCYMFYIFIATQKNYLEQF